MFCVVAYLEERDRLETSLLSLLCLFFFSGTAHYQERLRIVSALSQPELGMAAGATERLWSHMCARERTAQGVGLPCTGSLWLLSDEQGPHNTGQSSRELLVNALIRSVCKDKTCCNGGKTRVCASSLTALPILEPRPSGPRPREYERGKAAQPY